MTAPVTKESLKKMLENPNTKYVDQVIGRALVAIFKNQTESEQRTNETRVHNGIGFTGADGHSGALTAKYFMSHHSLTAWQREMWLKPNKHGEPRILKYHKQLAEAAKMRAATELNLVK